MEPRTAYFIGYCSVYHLCMTQVSPRYHLCINQILDVMNSFGLLVEEDPVVTEWNSILPWNMVLKLE